MRVFASYMSKRKLITGVYKELEKSSTLKYGLDFYREFSIEEIKSLEIPQKVFYHP